MSGGSTTNLAPIGEAFLGDVAAALRGADPDAFAAQVARPVLVELPSGGLEPGVGAYAFDAPPDAQRAGWEERLSRLRERLPAADVKVRFLHPREGPWVIGAAPGADVRLSPEDGVAPRHAELLLRGELWRVRDLEAGTWVEGKRLPPGIPLPIVGGHRLRVGGAELLFLSPAQLHALATPAASAPAPRPGLAPPPRGIELKAFADAASRLTPEAFERACPGPFLLQVPQVLVEGGDAAASGARTRSLTLEELLGLSRDRKARTAVVHGLGAADAVVVGRDAGVCHVVLPETAVSRRHAVLNRLRGQLVLMDLESQNGTWLEGKRLPAGVTTPVRSGQVVGFGTYRAVLLDAAAMHTLAERVASEPTQKLRR
ncbi:MAG: FHA domain-containing protein [Planctomycetes bacterium]|nr:FHA domain-containing protein [Planctomycetota bacterium]